MSGSDTTRDDVRRLFEKIDDIHQKVTRIEANCGPCQATVADNHQAIRGNGQGLMTRTAMLEGAIETLQADAKSSNDNPKLTLKQWAAIAAVFGALGFGGSWLGNVATGGQQTHQAPPTIESRGE